MLSQQVIGLKFQAGEKNKKLDKTSFYNYLHGSYHEKNLTIPRITSNAMSTIAILSILTREEKKKI